MARIQGNDKDIEFEAYRVGRDVAFLLITKYGEITATFSTERASQCEAKIAAAVNEVHSLGECDACGKEKPLSRCFAFGIETFACDECRGGETGF